MMTVAQLRAFCTQAQQDGLTTVILHSRRAPAGPGSNKPTHMGQVPFLVHGHDRYNWFVMANITTLLAFCSRIAPEQRLPVRLPTDPTAHDPWDWRTMDTAPRDGTELRAMMPDGTIHERAVWWSVHGPKSKEVPTGFYSKVAMNNGVYKLDFIGAPAQWQPL